MNEPKRITAGSSYEWTESLPDYPSDDGWALVYSLVNQNNQYEITSTASGSDYTVTLTTGDSVGYVEGVYKLIGYMTNTDKRVAVSSQRLIVRPDYATVADLRSYAEKALEAIEAMFLESASKDQMSITIDGQTLARRSTPDLIMLRDRLKREVMAYRKVKKARRNGRTPGKIQTRLK
ncbi:MAG: hypothetical protein GY818_07100 [Planctomycetaceae bacterium]|nr:hypothetical protein [Planctomycetaceae bacterium]